jgi:MFS family permease
MVAIYIFFQQLGSILGLILGGYITDGIGWRWSQPIVAIACVSLTVLTFTQDIGADSHQGILILLFIFTFDDTMFPRYRFGNSGPSAAKTETCTTQDDAQVISEKDQKLEPSTSVAVSHGAGEVDIPPRTYRQKVALIHYLEDDQTTWYQYFRRPFFLFAFPNIVLAGIQFAFGCTAGIISFNTISEIMTEPPYNWSAGSVGLLFLAALVGNFIG